MSAQILVQGRLTGTEEFLLAPPADRDNRAFEARLTWLNLLGEVLPRALLASLQLPPLLLGSSGGGRFLAILPDQERLDLASQFLARANTVLKDATAGGVRIVWSATENLGDWTVVRKRLAEGLRASLRPAVSSDGFFEPAPVAAVGADRIPRNLRDAASVAFSFDYPALIAVPEGDAGAGDLRWDLSGHASTASISMARHAARNGDIPATPKELALRSTGARLWGVLRGEIDDYGTRIRRAASVEEHVSLSMTYQQFLAGEIELLCSHADYFRRVTVIEAGSADFALFGSWDALAGFARELERVFARFAEENLKDLAGGEAKTMTMALTLAEPATPLARVWEASTRDLSVAKSSDKDCFYILDHVLEWKQWKDAAELKDALVQLNEEFRGGRHFLAQLRNLYRKVESPEPDGTSAASNQDERLMARAARFQRRFSGVANRREREFLKLRANLMKEMTGRKSRGKLRLKPEGLVALEWARLLED
jgi:CRISPR-associated protein Csm1